MSAERLREAAKVLRERAATEATLRDGYPYYTTEASAFERTMHPGVAMAVADWLDEEASAWDFSGWQQSDNASAVADAVLGGAS